MSDGTTARAHEVAIEALLDAGRGRHAVPYPYDEPTA